MLTSKQRAYLRSLSNNMSPIFQVGKGGISEEMCLQIGNALTARELMKASVLANSDYTAREAADTIAEYLGADVVSVSGNRFVLYRESEDKKTIILP